MFDFIGEFMSGIMNFVLVNLSGGNYAVAIILFTLLIKIVLLPLDIRSRKSMRRMGDVQPLIAQINEKYKNDPEKRNQKTMELYKKEKVSPMGGCLPMLLQFPVLIAMFAVIRTLSSEQTMMMFLNVQAGADFTAPDFLDSFLWIKNFWQPDNFTASGTIIPLEQAVAQIKAVASSSILTPENVANMQRNYAQVMQGPIAFYNNISMNGWGFLPLIVFGSQLLMQKISPQQPAPQGQAGKNAGMMKMMGYAMPLVFVFICWGYSAAFSFYFVVSNIYMLIQNLLINLYFDQQKKKKEREVSTV